MARSPEQNRAIYERRKARAIEQGYKGYSGRGGARVERKALRVKPTDVTARPRQVVDLPGGRLTKTPAQRHVIQAVRDAAAAGQRVSIQVTFQTSYGQWRTRDLSKSWYSVIDAATRAGLDHRVRVRGPRRGRSRPAGAGPSPSKPVQVRAGILEGPLASDWLALFDAYDDIWDALFDAWEEEGSG